ncbi:hypothetical protein PMAYCL1PPCAC_10521, partial [Pristionchus mayeri]
ASLYYKDVKYFFVRLQEKLDAYSEEYGLEYKEIKVPRFEDNLIDPVEQAFVLLKTIGDVWPLLKVAPCKKAAEVAARRMVVLIGHLLYFILEIEFFSCVH